MAIGDVDRTAGNEIVVVSPKEIYVYRLKDGRPLEIARQDTGSQHYNIGVDVADINGNGRAEIFVTALNIRKNVVRSYVREFDGKTFVEIANNLAWYFRASDLPLRGRVLLGQQSRLQEPYRGGIFEMDGPRAPRGPRIRSAPPAVPASTSWALPWAMCRTMAKRPWWPSIRATASLSSRRPGVSLDKRRQIRRQHSLCRRRKDRQGTRR